MVRCVYGLSRAASAIRRSPVCLISRTEEWASESPKLREVVRTLSQGACDAGSNIALDT
jgi:hypothetical protein